ncbi:MAG: hypothetical protein IT425_09710 [Pirellulales bacterium]|nr:hypothetical protein [Pirellulales bacterium]
MPRKPSNKVPRKVASNPLKPAKLQHRNAKPSRAKGVSASDGHPRGSQVAVAEQARSTAVSRPPVVRLEGQIEHPDFRESLALLARTSRLTTSAEQSPDVIVVAQSRPGTASRALLESFKSTAPRAGVVVLAGSWCEGELRTGKPWPNVPRLYWYAFPTWWNQQLARRTAGGDPCWLMQTAPLFVEESNPVNPMSAATNRGELMRDLIHVSSRDRESAAAIADALQSTGIVTVWRRPGQQIPASSSAVAGVWDGGQLTESEARDLATFCGRLAGHGASVVALLDFPRRDRVDLAYRLGAHAVLGKPWLAADLADCISAAATATQTNKAA